MQAPNLGRKRLFVIGFSRAYRRELTEALREEGYVASPYQSFALARYAIAQQAPDALLLDGVGESLTFVQRYGGFLPSFILSERNVLMEVVTALREGAADYIKLPCYFPEILARIERNLPHASAVQPIEVGDITLDTASGVVRVAGDAVALGTRESLILATLLRCPQTPVTRQSLIRVAGMGHAKPTIIESYVKSLRSRHQRLRRSIRTCYGRGYVFMPEKP